VTAQQRILDLEAVILLYSYNRVNRTAFHGVGACTPKRGTTGQEDEDDRGATRRAPDRTCLA
jgi:hypothetical protein